MSHSRWLPAFKASLVMMALGVMSSGCWYHDRDARYGDRHDHHDDHRDDRR